jgi:hypothetical protein
MPTDDHRRGKVKHTENGPSTRVAEEPAGMADKPFACENDSISHLHNPPDHVLKSRPPGSLLLEQFILSLWIYDILGGTSEKVLRLLLSAHCSSKLANGVSRESYSYTYVYM